MPLYESEEITRDELYELRKKQTCAECGDMLNVFFDWDRKTAYLACNDFNRTHHNGIAKEARLYEPNIKTKEEEMTQELGTEKTRELMRYYGGALDTQDKAMEVLDTIWPDTPKAEKIKAAMLCVQYQLNPLMKHVYLMKFKGKDGPTWATVLGIQANRLIAHRAGKFSYIDNTPRIMTKDEQETIFGEVATDRIWAITKLKDGKGNQAQGYGFWMKADSPYGQDKGNTKHNMAFIRSERQALDRLFAGAMPQGIEVVDERFQELENGRGIDTETGEILEPLAETAVADPEPEPKIEDGIFTEEQPSPETTKSTAEPKDGDTVTLTPGGLDLEAFHEEMKQRNWTDESILNYLKNAFSVEAKTADEALKKLTKKQTDDFMNKVVAQAKSVKKK